jgi:hypothetical protein
MLVGKVSVKVWNLARILNLWILVDWSVGISAEGVGENAYKTPDRENDKKTNDTPEDTLSDDRALFWLVPRHDIADGIEDDVDDCKGDKDLNNDVTDVGKLVCQ